MTAAGWFASAWSSPTACTRPGGARSSAETEAFWAEFLRRVVPRGLVGVQLVIPDAHEGLKNAIAKVLGAPRQRCTVHFLRDCLGHARKDQHGLLGALIRAIFNAAGLAGARDQLSEAVATLEGKLPKVATMLEAAEFATPACGGCATSAVSAGKQVRMHERRRESSIGREGRPHRWAGRRPLRELA